VELKDLAVAELAWAMNREENYKADGAPVPEPIRRLKALAEAAQSASSSVPSPDLHTLREGLCHTFVRLGLKVPDAPASTVDLITMLGEAEKRAANGVAARDVVDRCNAALQDGANVLLGVARELGGLFIAGDSKALPVGLRAHADATTTGPGIDSPRVHGEPIPLRHGLLLKRTTTGHRALFSEVKQHEFVYVWISEDGAKSTDPTGTTADNWRTDAWQECADQIQVKPIDTLAPSTKAPDSGPPFIRDWNPSAEDVAKKQIDLAAAMQKAGVSVEIDAARLVERFKTEKGSERAQKPGTAFHFWAIRTLKGG
jgi:hypothetical protein